MEHQIPSATLISCASKASNGNSGVQSPRGLPAGVAAVATVSPSTSGLDLHLRPVSHAVLL